jgi:hypothetical protein
MGVTMSGVQERRAALVAGQGAVAEDLDVAERDRRLQRRRGHQVMAAFATFGDAAESGRLKRAIKISHLICITFVCVTPVLLFWSVALNG